MQVLPPHCQRKKPDNSPLNCGPRIRHILIQLITVCWGYCKRRCTNMHHWSGWTETTTENGWSGPSWIMSILWQPFVSGVVDSARSEMRVLYTLYRNNLHRLLTNGFKSGECGGHSWGEINSGVSFCNNAMVARRAQWSFQISQGSVWPNTPLKMVTVTAVSYTHLTLPTKRIV